jgi:hypothetical protein
LISCQNDRGSSRASIQTTATATQGAKRMRRDQFAIKKMSRDQYPNGRFGARGVILRGK